MSFSRLLFIVAGAVLLGFGLFALLAYRSTSVMSATRDQAWVEFQSVLADEEGREPVLVCDSFGHPHVNLSPPDLPVPAPTRLLVLAYRPRSQALVRVDLPYWLFQSKGPFVKIALRDTGFDLGDLGLDARQLSEYGPGIVINDQRPDGDWVLVWAE